MPLLNNRTKIIKEKRNMDHPISRESALSPIRANTFTERPPFSRTAIP